MDLEVPIPYELTEVDAQKLGYVNFDLKTLELVEEKSDDDFSCNPENVTRDVVNSFLETNLTIEDYKKAFDFSKREYFKNELVSYFRNIHTRLQLNDVTYLNVFDEDIEGWDYDLYYDYASFGTQFWYFLVECDLFPREVLFGISKLIYCYLKLHPQEILVFREKIVKSRLQFAIDPQITIKFSELKSIIDKALKPIDKCELFISLSRLSSNQERIDHFVQSVGVPSSRMELTDFLRKAIESIFPIELKPEFAQVGNLANMNIDYRVLHFQLSFGISKILDRSTLSLVLSCVMRVMKKIELTGEVTNSVRFVEFEIDDENLPIRKLIFSISSESSSFNNLINFYLGYDSRFGQMILLFKYYFTESNLLFGDVFENESFIWLIVWFLQQTKPSTVLPTLNALMLSQPHTDLNSIPPSSNHESIGELVLQFIEWFYHFDFGSFMLNLLDGSSSYKSSCYLCISNPFTNSVKTKFTIKILDSWKNVFGKLMDDCNIDSKNYLLGLTNPDCFIDPNSDESKLAYTNHDLMNPYKLKPKSAEGLDYPQDVSNLKLQPKSNQFANHHLSTQLADEFQFSKDFFFSSEPINKILESYNRDDLELHYNNILDYFCYLQLRLQKCNNLNYYELVEDKFDDDYAAYGEQFWQFLIKCQLFQMPYLRNYSVVESGPNQEPQVLDSNLVSYTPVTKNSFHEQIADLKKPNHQIDHLLDQVYHADQSKKFSDFILELINSDKDFADLKLSLEQTSVLAGGFNIFMNDFHFAVRFGGISEDLDPSTFLMALQVIEKFISVRFKFDSKSKMDKHTFRFKLSSNEPSSKTSANFIVKLTSSSRIDYTGNVFTMLSQYDKRFAQVVCILRYWAKLQKFNSGTPFFPQQFVWLIVHFLQQTSPLVLPPLERFMKYGIVKLIKPSTNEESTLELVVKFLKFCSQFDFTNQVICPLDGASYTKKDFCKIKSCKLVKDSFSRIENPLSRKTFQLNEKSAEQFVKFVTKLLNEEKIVPKNCIVKLTDPSISHS